MNPEVHPEMLKLYRDYTYVRSCLYYQKDILKKPKIEWEYPEYSPEPLKGYRFTNVRRELDKETRYLIEVIMPDIKNDYNLENIILNTVLFRSAINKGECWENITNKLSDKNYFDFFNKLDYNKLLKIDLLDIGNIQGNAYMSSGFKRVANWKSDLHVKSDIKLINFIRYVDMLKDQIIFSFNLLKDKKYEESLLALSKIYGIGEFLAYQIYSDFCYILNDNKGLDTGVFCGPGTKAGLDIIFKNKAGLDYNDLLLWFRNNVDKLMVENKLEWNVDEFLHFLPKEKRIWDNSSVANSFCEFKKLVNILNKEKSRRRKYG